VCGAVGGVVAAWLLSAPRGRATSGSGSGGGGSPVRDRPPSPVGGSDLHGALDRALTP
jgi:hypothetical protein